MVGDNEDNMIEDNEEDMVGDNEDNMIEDNEEDKDFANEDGDEDKDVDLPVGTYGPLTTDP